MRKNKIKLYGTRHGKVYLDALMHELDLDEKQRKLVTVYALLNQISWTCENGIQFNQTLLFLEVLQQEKLYCLTRYCVTFQ